MSVNQAHIDEVVRLLSDRSGGLTTREIYDTGEGFQAPADAAAAINHLKRQGQVTTDDQAAAGRVHRLVRECGQSSQSGHTAAPPAPVSAGKASPGETLRQILQAASAPLSSREVFEQSDVFKDVTHVSQTALAERKAGRLVTEKAERDGKVVGVHRLLNPGESRENKSADHKSAAVKKPARKRTSPTRAPAQAAEAPQPATGGLGSITREARRLVDEHVAGLDDSYLQRLITLERAACAAQPGETA